MEESGLVKRTRSADDERVVLVEITDKGMAMRDKLKEVPGHVGQCLHLDKEDALILYQELYKVLKGFSE
jgi:DNA-binding MarR family transcriptional regulator